MAHMADQEWHFVQFPAPNGVWDAVNFLNAAPRQGHGEASATIRKDGSVGLFFLDPGSLDRDDSPGWLPAWFDVSGAQQATAVLNLAPTQSAGEASVTLRKDDSAGMLFLSPGAGTAQTWRAAELPGPFGVQEAVLVLNLEPRQGAGEACITPHDDGSAGLLILDPGSLGASTEETWFIAEFPAPNGANEAVAFLNADPRQGPGEATGIARNDGSAVIIYLEPSRDGR